MKHCLYYIRKNVIIVIFHSPCRCGERRKGFLHKIGDDGTVADYINKSSISP